MVRKKLSPAKKKLLYALLGSSLLWQSPAIVLAAEDAAPASPPAEEQTASTETTGTQSFSLGGIEVTAQRDGNIPPAYAGGQVARGGSLGVLGNRDFMDTPFSLTGYTAQTMDNQQASTLHDVLINDASIRFSTSGGHIRENFTIRGLEVNADAMNFNGMPGIAPMDHVAVEFIERVEVFKGPGNFLSGGVNLNVGGTVNLVPKRAGDTPVTAFTADYATSDQLGGHIDIGRRYGANKEVGIRFNGVYKDGKTATDGQSKERLLGALGMDYQSGKLRLGLDAYGTEERYTNGSVSMYELSNGVVEAPDGSTNLLKGTYGASDNNAVLFKGEYDLTGNLTAYAGMGSLSSTSTGSISGNHARSVQLNGNATVRRYNQYWWTDTFSAEYGLRGKFKTGTVNHQLVAGHNVTTSENGNHSSNFLVDTVNIYNPVTITTMAPAPAKPRKSNDKDFSSTFFADTLSFDQDKIQLTLGLRDQKVIQRTFNVSNGALVSVYDSSATTPIAGVVVKPWGNAVSLYASYIEGLSPGRMVPAGYDNEFEVLAPYRSKQQEFGVKWDKGQFANTLAFYQITKPSEVVVSNYMSYDGEQKNQGVEWTFFGKVSENVRLLGGVTRQQGKLVRTNGGANQGKTPYGVPEWMINAGAEWDTPWNRDLTLSLRAVYTGSQYINSANSRTIPSWIRYDVGARYKTTIKQTPVTFYASVENVFNKNYWASCFSEDYVTLGGPRTVKLSATMQF